MNTARKLIRGIDFFVAVILSIVFLIFLSIRRVFGKIQIKDTKDRVLSITKDGIYRILQCNGKNYFE